MVPNHPAHRESAGPDPPSMRSFAHDAPTWGPYAKQYAGAAAIVQRELGVRWDCCVFPAIFRGPVTVPCHRWDSGFNPIWASPDLAAYAYEFELPLWRDELRAEVAYARVGEGAMAFLATFRNGGARDRSLSLHLCAGLALPWIRDGRAAGGPCLLEPREGETWVPGAGYRSLDKTAVGFRDGLPYDARIPGECAADGAVGGFCFRWDSTQHRGATVRYALPRPGGRRVFARVRFPDGAGELNGLRIATGDRWQWWPVPVEADAEELGLCWTGGEAPELNGLLITSHDEPPEVPAAPWAFAPVEVVELSASARLLRYEGLDRWFGVAWRGGDAKWREFRGAALEEMLPPVVHHHVATSFSGRGEGHFINAFLHGVSARAGEATELGGVFATGTREDVEATLRDADSWDGGARMRIHAARDATAGSVGRTRLAATLLTNVVYPVRRFGEWFAHRSPGKWWDSLYTWDSGFIGLGLLEINPALAMESLDHYLCEPANAHAAFVHHGSLVPTQVMLALEIWNRTRDRIWLRRVLPALRRYYRFFAGHSAPGVIADLGSGLLRPWDYFYNSGGWDDYPAQVAVHREHLAGRTTPVVTTAMAILFAKILDGLERAAGKVETMDYGSDAGRFSAALQAHAWDEEAGVFSYVLHDAGGLPTGIFRHVGSGLNHNLGLDGVMPLAAGAVTERQRDRLLDLIFDPRRLWTPLGVTAVDQSAPYYDPNGYWNGTVWLPYQWVLWKTMLDLGEWDRADRIATAIARLWEESVGETGRCYEHFVTATRQGAGWHHFGGLSAPAVCFHDAVHTPGRLTCGLRMVLGDERFETDGVRRVCFRRDAAETSAVILLGAGLGDKLPVVKLDGRDLECRPLAVGGFAITVPAGCLKGELWMTPPAR